MLVILLRWQVITLSGKLVCKKNIPIMVRYTLHYLYEGIKKEEMSNFHWARKKFQCYSACIISLAKYECLLWEATVSLQSAAVTFLIEILLTEISVWKQSVFCFLSSFPVPLRQKPQKLQWVHEWTALLSKQKNTHCIPTGAASCKMDMIPVVTW